MLWNLDGKIRHSFNNRILSILSAFLWETEAILLPKKNFLLKYASHKYKMRNKGGEIPLFTKKYQIFYCLKLFEWLLVLCLALALHSFPRRCQVLDAGNHSVQQLRFWLLPYSSCLFCLCGQEGPPNGSVGSQKW